MHHYSATFPFQPAALSQLDQSLPMANNTWDVECDNWSQHPPFFIIVTLYRSIDLEELSQVLAHPLLGGHLGLQWHKGQEDDRSAGKFQLLQNGSKL